MTRYIYENCRRPGKAHRRIDEISAMLSDANQPLTESEIFELIDEKKRLLETCRQANRIAEATRFL